MMFLSIGRWLTSMLIFRGCTFLLFAEHFFQNLKVPKETEEMAALRSAMEDIRSLAETSQKDQPQKCAGSILKITPSQKLTYPIQG